MWWRCTLCECLVYRDSGPTLIPQDVLVEMYDAHAEHGSHNSHERWVTIMTEEVGEIARAVLHEDVEGKALDLPSRQELVQLASICLRALDDWK